jgi:hypothetical protein
MGLLLRRISVLLIAVGLVFGGATSHALAGASADAAAAMHDSRQIQSYADLAIEPGEHDCAQATADASGDVPSPPPNDGPCKKCCAACMSVSLLPETLASMMSVSHSREVDASALATLVAFDIPTDPGIPKSL